MEPNGCMTGVNSWVAMYWFSENRNFAFENVARV
jgi:hypothetical protein